MEKSPQCSPEASKKASRVSIVKPAKTTAELAKAIEDGNETLAIDILKKKPDLINFQDGFAKLTVLQKSIYKQRDQIIDHVIKQSNLKLDADTLLHAVCVGKEEYVEKLLDAMNKRKLESKKANPNSWCFEPYMTPLMLACLLDDFETVKLLRAKGHELDIPHRANCACVTCDKDRKGGEDMKSSEKRFAVLQSLSSPAYLLQDDNEDPVMDSIMLCRELEKCEDLEHAMAARYKSLREGLGKIPLTIMAECSTDDQARMILRNPVGASTDCAIALPRLRVALDMHNKEFLAERKCQKIIYNEWMGEWSDWQLVAPRVQSVRILTQTLFFPITALAFVFSRGKFPSSCRVPFARFLSFGTSHLLYLCGLLAIMQYEEMRDEIGPPHLLIKKLLFGYVWLYVAGDFIVTMTDVWRLGFRRFFDVWWRWYIIVVTFLNLIAFHAFCIAWDHARIENYPKLHRSHWDPLEPTLIFEILFASSSILATWRIFYFFQLNRTIGPTIISIGRCFKDVALYIIIISIFIMSFAIGLNFLYEHYKYNVAVGADGTTTEQSYHMASIHMAFRYLYWSFYGYLPPENFEAVVGNSGPNQTETKHAIIAISGEYFVAFYHMCIITIMLNLMVSMMTGTAAKIMANQDLEWKYFCTHLRAEYFDDSRSTPPPFCLLQFATNAPVMLFRKISGVGKHTVLSIWDMNYKDPEFSKSEYAQHVNLMRTLKRNILAKRELKNIIKEDKV